MDRATEGLNDLEAIGNLDPVEDLKWNRDCRTTGTTVFLVNDSKLHLNKIKKQRLMSLDAGFPRPRVCRFYGYRAAREF